MIDDKFLNYSHVKESQSDQNFKQAESEYQFVDSVVVHVERKRIQDLLLEDRIYKGINWFKENLVCTLPYHTQYYYYYIVIRTN